MMKQEFEKIAKVEVTSEQYEAIEKLYMESSLEKTEFIKSIKPMLKTLQKPEKRAGIVRIAISDNSGYMVTPNGCWHHVIEAEIIDCDIATGKIKVRKIPNTYELSNEYNYTENQVQFV